MRNSKRFIRYVRVIKEPGDAKKDYFLEDTIAWSLYQAGKLQMDMTNGCFIVKK
jgi:hypothetical protein